MHLILNYELFGDPWARITTHIALQRGLWSWKQEVQDCLIEPLWILFLRHVAGLLEDLQSSICSKFPAFAFTFRKF